MQEVCLEVQFVEDVDALFEMYETIRVSAGNVKSTFGHRYSSECSTELIDLGIL